MPNRIILLLLVCCLISSESAVVQALPSEINQSAQLIVKSSPEAAYQSQVAVPSKLIKMLFKGVTMKTNEYPVSDTYLEITQKPYIVDPSCNLYDIRRAELIMPPNHVKKLLEKYVSALRITHYGKMMTWEEGKRFLYLKSIFTVTDLQTGLHFQVQRRAGSTHADVQPLTKRDTEVMKQIYGGKWSWKRKAILVIKNGQTVAASMHGMPHGGDGIPDNGFRGHFCIHFLGSSTHGTGQVDRDHQVMVHKAAGSLLPYVQRSSPFQMVDLYFTAINQKDPEIVSALFQHRRHAAFYVRRDISPIIAIRRTSDYVEKDMSDMLAADIPIRADVFSAGSKKSAVWVFQLRRNALWQPWRMETIEMK
ncbi:MAG TPA: hypothetical protein VMS09_15875 [Paenibacillus sp.]|uniref:hypothetical protein n=1 Tax=Paenibacillus sp. TaxID=58172 RepID=UPI0028D50F08|nr:hypothetical protein [Paenibacillus sp.]HUC93474.1 hypothetical protein [Paenibacillus sp.]